MATSWKGTGDAYWPGDTSAPGPVAHVHDESTLGWLREFLGDLGIETGGANDAELMQYPIEAHFRATGLPESRFCTSCFSGV
jgi:hypothetical protein